METDNLIARIFIPGNVPSLKNSKIVTKNGVFMSKTCTKYIRSLGIQSYSVSKKTVKGYKNKPNAFEILTTPLKQIFQDRPKPIILGMYFVRKTRHRFDFINAAQIICDLLVAHDVIDDDNIDNLIPAAIEVNGSYYKHDKDNPGVWLYY